MKKILCQSALSLQIFLKNFWFYFFRTWLFQEQTFISAFSSRRKGSQAIPIVLEILKFYRRENTQKLKQDRYIKDKMYRFYLKIRSCAEFLPAWGRQIRLETSNNVSQTCLKLSCTILPFLKRQNFQANESPQQKERNSNYLGRTSFLYKLVLSLVLSSPVLAYSAGGEFSPRAVFIQIFNFSIFLLAFLFLVRKPFQTLFHKRQKDFFSFEEQALKLEKEKQAEQELWKKKLSALEKTEENIQKQAQEEGERFKVQKQEELKELSERLKKTSGFLLNLEEKKLKRESLRYWKIQLVETVRTDLKQLALEEAFQKQEQVAFLDLLKKKKLNEKKELLK